MGHDGEHDILVGGRHPMPAQREVAGNGPGGLAARTVFEVDHSGAAGVVLGTLLQHQSRWQRGTFAIFAHHSEFALDRPGVRRIDAELGEYRDHDIGVDHHLALFGIFVLGGDTVEVSEGHEVRIHPFSIAARRGPRYPV
jgi:hypothetical protein